MHDASSTLRFGTPLAAAKLAVILLHGRGGDPEDMVGLAEALPPDDVAYLAPAAEGGSWYPQRFLAPLDANEPDLSAALSVVEQLVRECREAGRPAGRIAVGGFSQGACLALEFAARQPAEYAFVAALSGALIGPAATVRPSFRLPGTPVLFGCAERDGHIPLDYVERSAAAFTAAGAEVTKQIYPGSTHTIFPAEIRWLTERVQSIVTGSPA